MTMLVTSFVVRPAPVSSTAPEPVPAADLRRFRTLRRAAVGALGLVVLLGATNLFGVRPATVSASANGTTLEVTYAAVTRPGLATPWSVTVRRPGGFAEAIRVVTTASYFDGFDLNGWYPEPAAMARRGGALVMTFEPPPGDSLTVTFDGRATPTFGLGRRATTAVAVGGSWGPSVTYRTWVMP